MSEKHKLGESDETFQVSLKFFYVSLIAHIGSLALLLCGAFEITRFLPEELELPYMVGIPVGILVHYMYLHAHTHGPFVPALRSGRNGANFFVFGLLFLIASMLGSLLFPKGMVALLYAAGMCASLAILEFHTRASNYLFKRYVENNAQKSTTTTVATGGE